MTEWEQLPLWQPSKLWEQTITIRLNEVERRILGIQFRFIGKWRHKATRKAWHGYGSAADAEHLNNPKNDVRGVACELVIGKALNLYVPFGPKAAVDVGDVIEARSCPFATQEHGFLFVKPPDKNLPFVLCNCDLEKQGVYKLMGYIDAQEAKDTYPLTRMMGTKGAPRDWAHAVHHSNLKPMEWLIGQVCVDRLVRGLREPVSIVVQPTFIEREYDYAEAV